MQDSPALVFALTLKRWFRANGWPQKITDDWAKDPGVNYQHGPWASQICGALKGDGYSPRAEFFIALAVFNQAVKDQSFKGIQSQTLKNRLEGSVPMAHDDGQLYSPTDFWALFAGQIQPPTAYAANKELTQEDVDEWCRLVRTDFREVSLKHMVSRGEAWAMLRERMLEIEREAGFPANESADCLDWMQEVLAGFREPTVEEAIRQAKRWQGTQPFQRAIEELLGTKKPKSIVLDARRSTAKPQNSPSTIL